jgi:hypothetical protein
MKSWAPYRGTAWIITTVRPTLLKKAAPIFNISPFDSTDFAADLEQKWAKSKACPYISDMISEFAL